MIKQLPTSYTRVIIGLNVDAEIDIIAKKTDAWSFNCPHGKNASKLFSFGTKRTPACLLESYGQHFNVHFYSLFICSLKLFYIKTLSEHFL